VPLVRAAAPSQEKRRVNHGNVVLVEEEIAGSELAADALTGSTSVTLVAPTERVAVARVAVAPVLIAEHEEPLQAA
jgi:hypothetical protein